MAYKKLIKVSNVCQLLDKSKYPATGTMNGITFTNNGDGTITANGTATYVINLIILEGFPIKKNHKYLILDCTGSTSRTNYSTWLKSKLGAIVCDSADKPIGNLTYNDDKCIVFVRVENGITVSNLTFKPQLFDLTEMYGAGNEPTTVEQFRQDFPEEMYDYSPYCWLTSYKRVFMTGGGNCLTSYQRNLTCKTKNLFDAKAIKNTSIKVSINGSVIIIPQSPSPNGYTTSGATLSELCPNLKVGDTAILNFKTTSAYGRYIWLSTHYNKSWSIGDKKIITEEMLNSKVVMYGANIDNGETGQVIITNFQIELGNTATDYVPYGHL